MSSNLNFYYLYKYGTPTGSGYSSLTNGGAIQGNNFVGAMLKYNRFDLNGTMDFVTDNTEDSTSDDNYTDFYNSYKSVVGSDVMSYMNKYANTGSMALGDMVNTKEGTNSSYIDNLTADPQTFGFHTTKDGDPYRFTFDGTGTALQDINGDGAADFTDLSKSYQEYANYVTEKLAGSTTATLSGNTSAVDLSKLGIDYATILAKVGDVTTAKAIYQNLINQFVTEATALKAGTISSDNLATMDRDLDDKQRGLKSIDDELFGYVEKGAAISTSKTSYSLTNTINSASFSGAGKTAITNASKSYGITPGSGATDTTSLLDALGSISVSGQGTTTGAVSEFATQLKVKVEQWVDKNINTAAATPFAPIAATTAAAPVVTSTDANVSNYLSAAASNASIPTDTLANIKTWVTNNATQTYTDEKTKTTSSVTLAGAEIDNAANLLWNSIATSTFTTKAQFTSFISSSYGASTPANLNSADQDNATNILYRNYLATAQKDSYINDLTTAIMGNVSNTQAQTDTETTLIQNMDITARAADNNYSDAGGAMYLDDASDLKSLVDNIFNDTRNLGYHKISHWYGDNIYIADNYCLPGENVFQALSKMGINITKNADGTDVVDGTANDIKWDTCNTSNGCYNGSYGPDNQAAMYAAINSGGITLVNDKDGKFHFTYNSKTYYINTKVSCDLSSGINSTIDADGVAGTIENFTREGDYRGAITNDVKAAFASGKVSGGTGSLDLRHLKVTDPTKGAVLTLDGTNNLTAVTNAATQTLNSGNFNDFSAASAFNMGTDSTDVTYDASGNETDTPYSSTTTQNVIASTASTQTLQYQYNLTNFPFTADGYLFQNKDALDHYNKVKSGTADVGTIACAWTNPVVTQTQTWDPNFTDSQGNQVGAWTEGAETYTATAVEIKANVKLNTDPNSLVYQLASSLVTSSDITGTGIAGQADPTPKQKQEFAIYLSEVSAAIMEQYWVENFNKSDAEPIDKYFAREFSAYLNSSATSANKDFNFVDSDNKIAHFAINFDENPKVTNIVDKILEKQSWAQMYTKMEDRSRTEMSLFEEATSMDTVANINNKEYEYRMALIEAMQKESDAKTLDMDFSKVNKNLVTEGAGAEKNPWWSSYFPWFKGTYGNLPDGATPADMFDSTGHLAMSYGNNVDPYLVKINNVDYVMGKDDNQDGEISDTQEILGITDTVDTSFTSLKALDTNKDGFVSQDELKAQHIIFKAMNSSDRMNGSSISSDFIRGIDLSTLEKGDGTNNIYGLFNVQLTNGQKAAAVQTFESQSYFNNLFGDYADMSFLNNTKATATTTATAATTAKTSTSTSATTSTTTSTNTEDAKTKEMLLGKNFNFFSYLNNTTSDDSSATKTPVLTDNSDDTILVDDKEVSLSSLVDEFCWKFDVNKITAKQKYTILGGVDTSKSSDVIVKKIEDEVSKLHTEFSA